MFLSNLISCVRILSLKHKVEFFQDDKENAVIDVVILITKPRGLKALKLWWSYMFSGAIQHHVGDVARWLKTMRLTFGSGL